jgi:hypothetical protein
MVDAPGVALDSKGFQDPARSRAFLVTLLIRDTFDVLIDFPRVLSTAPESTEIVEALWRRREAVPVARRGRGCAHRTGRDVIRLAYVPA